MTTFLLIRHGIPEHGAWGQPDAERALTPEGWDKTRRAMKGLVARGFAPGVVISSPYLRALQTRTCLLEALSTSPTEETWEGLVPEGSVPALEDAMRSWAGEADQDAVIALVAHQPILGDLVEHLTGRAVLMKRAAVSVVSLQGGIFRLQAHFLPAELRGEA